MDALTGPVVRLALEGVGFRGEVLQAHGAGLAVHVQRGRLRRGDQEPGGELGDRLYLARQDDVVFRPFPGLRLQDRAHLVLLRRQGAGHARWRADGGRQRGEADRITLMERREPLVGDELRLARAHECGGERIGLGAGDMVRASLGVDQVPLARAGGHVQGVAALQSTGALRLRRLLRSEDERSLLNRLPLAAGLFADGPAFGPACLFGRGQPVGRVRDAQDRTARDLPRVEDVVAHLDDLVGAVFHEQPGGGQIQHGVQAGVAVRLENDITRGRLLAHDDSCTGFVPAGRCGRLEHAPGSEDGQRQCPGDQARHHRAQRFGGALLRSRR